MGYSVGFATAEMMFPELGEHASNGLFRGGLGDLSGDIMEGFVRCGIDVLPTVYGYSVNYQTRTPVNYGDTPAHSLFNLDADIYWNTVTTPVWSADRAGAHVYLIGEPYGGYLYPGDPAKKLRQAAFFGRAVPALYKRLGVKPDIMWCQEWMTAFIIANMMDDPYFDGTKYLFTIHTSVPEALEKFDLAQWGDTALDMKWLRHFVRDGLIDPTWAGVSLADLVTCVSEEHGEVGRAMFPEYSGKILGIINGVSRDRLLSPRIKALGTNPNPYQLWAAHKEDKMDLLMHLKRETGIMLDPDEPLIGLVRRLARYKNQKDMFEPVIEAMCADRTEVIRGLRGLGANVFIGGVAHENDDECQRWMREVFPEWMNRPRIKGRLIYLPQYSERLRTLAIRGSDMWVECPWKRTEACGTGGFGAKFNGNINIATKGGGVKEHGTEISEDTTQGDTLFIEPYDSQTLYMKAQRACGWHDVWRFSRDDRLLHVRKRIFESAETLDVRYMIERYRDRCFEPLLRSIEQKAA